MFIYMMHLNKICPSIHWNLSHDHKHVPCRKGAWNPRSKNPKKHLRFPSQASSSCFVLTHVGLVFSSAKHQVKPLNVDHILSASLHYRLQHWPFFMCNKSNTSLQTCHSHLPGQWWVSLQSSCWNFTAFSGFNHSRIITSACWNNNLPMPSCLSGKK